MVKIKVFAKSEVDLTAKVGVWAYCLYDYRDQITNVLNFKKGIKTMTHADCMAFVNALYVLSLTINGAIVEELEIVTDSSKVEKLIMEGIGEKHCEAAAKFWTEKVKPSFAQLKVITIIKSDRKGTGKADNVEVLKKLSELGKRKLDKLKYQIK